MNFLAHIYLSGDDDFIKMGNFMADGIRGKQYQEFPAAIQKGIMLHRAIDTFTDAHALFRKSTQRLHADYHHYAGVIVDVFYDHFLAKNWDRYSTEKLEDYVDHFYSLLQAYPNLLTEKTKNLLPYMIQRNWLVSYAKIEGIERILTQMDARLNNRSNMRFATQALRESYEAFESEFTEFFEDLRQHAAEKLFTL